MRFDTGLHAHAGSLDGYPQLGEWLEQTQFAEQAGFTGVWAAEHHFFWDGWSTPTPTNPLMVGAYLAAQTSSVRIGQCGLSINDWHPIRLAEDVAMLDHMCGGRLDFGIMRGLNSRVNGNFHPDADRRDVPRANERMWETLDIVRKAWTGKAFRHDSEFFTLPVAGWVDESSDHLDPEFYSSTGELHSLAVYPTPYAHRTPPIWLMADSAFAHGDAAQRGLNVMCWGRSPRAAKESWDAYRAAEEPGQRGQLAMMRSVFVADTAEEAERKMRPALNGLFNNMGYSKNPSWGRKGMLGSDEELTAEMASCDWYDYLTAIDWAIVGTPEHVTEKLMELESEIGLEHLVLYWSVAELAPADVRRSQELFAEKVMPNFTDPAGAR
jgi:alkanesulfonate monooxygenase SsuD/methylene tetrahydromethanopterin reductase-like flavin-dependent oxidoreductase (luciferase family)